MRDVISLDGEWQFQHETDRIARTAQVPLPWQAQFADLRQTSGRAVYRRQFPRPKGEAVLRFGAVSYLAEVLVNGQTLGSHEGGYLPFEIAVPTALLKDVNDLEVRCLLPDGAPNDARIAFAEIPHGKQSWYGPIGGIWQSVAVEGRNPVHLSHCKIVAEVSGRVSLTLTLPQAALGAEVLVTISGAQGQAATTRVTVGAQQVEAVLDVAAPQLWSPDHPALYTAEVTLIKDGPVDRTSHTFGFRSFTTQGGQMFLNGQPFYMRAALDQDYYPEGICTPPSVA